MFLSDTFSDRWPFSSVATSVSLSHPLRKDDEENHTIQNEVRNIYSLSNGLILNSQKESSDWSTKVLSDQWRRQCCLLQQHSMFLAFFMIVLWIWKSTCGVFFFQRVHPKRSLWLEYSDFKNLFARLLKESKACWVGKHRNEADSITGLCEQKSSLSDLLCVYVQYWQDSWSIRFLKMTLSWEHSTYAQNCISTIVYVKKTDGSHVLTVRQWKKVETLNVLKCISTISKRISLWNTKAPFSLVQVRLKPWESAD